MKSRVAVHKNKPVMSEFRHSGDMTLHRQHQPASPPTIAAGRCHHRRHAAGRERRAESVYAGRCPDAGAAQQVSIEPAMQGTQTERNAGTGARGGYADRPGDGLTRHDLPHHAAGFPSWNFAMHDNVSCSFPLRGDMIPALPGGRRWKDGCSLPKEPHVTKPPGRDHQLL
jgi:hypothetical protein